MSEEVYCKNHPAEIEFEVNSVQFTVFSSARPARIVRKVPHSKYREFHHQHHNRTSPAQPNPISNVMPNNIRQEKGKSNWLLGLKEKTFLNVRPNMRVPETPESTTRYGTGPCWWTRDDWPRGAQNTRWHWIWRSNWSTLTRPVARRRRPLSRGDNLQIQNCY